MIQSNSIRLERKVRSLLFAGLLILGIGTVLSVQAVEKDPDCSSVTDHNQSTGEAQVTVGPGGKSNAEKAGVGKSKSDKK